MRRKLFLVVSIFLLLLVIALLYLSSHVSNLSSSQHQSNIFTPLLNSPYSISSFSQRNYDSNIVVVNQVRSTDKFISEVVSFTSDHLLQYALMNTPKGQTPPNGWPVVIVNHGYIDPKVYSTENSYINTSAYFANSGFLVVKPDYRGHAKSQGEAGSLVSRINYAVDVLNLLTAVKKLPNVDSHHIYMYGHSMGGDVTLRVLEICPTCVQAASLWAPAVTDWPESFLFFSKRNAQDAQGNERLKRYQKELTDLFSIQDYPQVSTLENINLIKTPLNIHHGTADDSVPYSWGLTLASKLTSAGKQVSFYSYPKDNHDISGNWNTALSRDVKLFHSIN